MDGTLIYSPHPETSIEIYKQKPGNNWPHVGWWSKPETLDYNIFDIETNKAVLNRLEIDNRDSNTHTVLLTARMEKLKSAVVDLLNNLNIKIDDITLKKDTEKDERIKNYISFFPNLKEVDIYDDREKEFKLFIPLKKELEENGIKVNIYKVDNENITKLYE